MNKLLIISIFGSLLLFQSFFAYSQHSSNPMFMSLSYRTGENKPHREVIKNLVYPYRGVDFKLGWQTTGERDWQRAFRYPSLGIGINYNTFKTEILGEPIASYFFINFPQFRTSWCQLDLEVNLGLSYGINPYNKITNPKNFSTGSSLNSIFGIFLEQSFHVSTKTDLFVSGGLCHYSNGALGYPNLGLNIPMIKFGIRNLVEAPDFIVSNEKPTFKHTLSINTYIGGGKKKLMAPEPNFYEVLVSPSIYYRTGYKRRIGIGYEIAYNQAKRGLNPPIEYTFQDLTSHAVHISHEYIIERFTILTQFGIYLKNQPADKFYFERIGFGYYLAKDIRAVLNVKAHYIKAEYIEAGLVYDLNLN